jgi:hypothetical protein
MAETEVEPRKDYLAPLEEHEDGISEGISVINTAEINQQIATAHRFPRSVTAFRRKVYEMVTLDVETAESCIYAIPRDGKMIDGPSIRFAEILLVGWGNYRAATEVTDIGERFITAEGMFMDLEINGAIKAKTMRRIVGKASDKHPNGKRFGDDMIVTTGNAASSIALRNAITRGIPKALWKELFDEAKKVAGGTAQTFGTRRDKVIKELGIQGATPDQIFALLGIKGPDDMQTEHLVHLRGLQNAIKDGEITVDDAFGPQLKPGEVQPRRPEQSAFARDDAPEKYKPRQTAEEEKTSTAADQETERLEMVKEFYTELDQQPSMPKVADLRERTIGLGVMTKDEETAWVKACDAKSNSLFEAAKAARKGGKKP